MGITEGSQKRLAAGSLAEKFIIFPWILGSKEQNACESIHIYKIIDIWLQGLGFKELRGLQPNTDKKS
eukprot:522770-Pelagomonas_calceolata.AAC.1